MNKIHKLYNQGYRVTDKKNGVATLVVKKGVIHQVPLDKVETRELIRVTRLLS